MDSPEREIQHIVDYMTSQARDETVEHLEKVASESVYGRRHDVWDVHTDKDRWWVITNPTNLYTQKQFPSDVPNVVAENLKQEQPATVSEKSLEDLGDCITVEVPLRGPKPPKPSKAKR